MLTDEIEAKTDRMVIPFRKPKGHVDTIIVSTGAVFSMSEFDHHLKSIHFVLSLDLLLAVVVRLKIELMSAELSICHFRKRWAETTGREIFIKFSFPGWMLMKSFKIKILFRINENSWIFNKIFSTVEKPRFCWLSQSSLITG